MLRFTQALNVAVAGLLVVPAVTLQGDAAGTLRESLERTLAALETLAGIERHLQEGASEAVALAVQHTEPPLELDAGDPGSRDRLLEALRADVGQLEAALERAERESGAGSDGSPGHSTPPSDPAGITTGLDDGLRELLASERCAPRSLRFTAPPPQAQASEPAHEKLALEEQGFTADPLRLAQAYYRKGQFEAAAQMLEQQAGLEALYWKARCLEKLGRHEEAFAAYTAVSEAPDAGTLRARALEDIEFLKWSLEFRRQAEERR
jgi:tetratricopeptide (TPR) repeat protein